MVKLLYNTVVIEIKILFRRINSDEMAKMNILDSIRETMSQYG